jgi:Putative antitoxin of bacterial toxin-antitoxin system, YdaS/YdaT
MNIVQAVVDFYTSQNKLAQALGVKRQNIRYYLDQGYFPAKKAILIERLTNSRFKLRELMNNEDFGPPATKARGQPRSLKDDKIKAIKRREKRGQSANASRSNDRPPKGR